MGMKTTVLAWSLFDFANTFFAVAMLSFHFPLWVVEDHGARELVFSIALGLSMACVAILMPFCGALSDATGERMRFLRWTTYGCVSATAAIAFVSHLGIALVFFGIANMCYQLGTVFYDALLWNVTAPDQLGRTSGVGAAFGYLGSMVGLLLLWPFAHFWGRQATFVPSAALFLLFALPSFLLIREPVRGLGERPWSDIARAAWLRLGITLRSARALGGFWRFLWASFFSLNAINTVLVFMGVYTRKVMGLTDLQVMEFFVLSQLCSILGSLVFSSMIPMWGAKRTLVWIWSGWIGALVMALLNPSSSLLWVVGPMIGLCLGATWATSRVLVMELSPKDQLAEMFGLAGLFARASSILGPLLWGFLVSEQSGYRRAIAMLIILLAIGIGLLRGVPYPSTGSAT